MILEVFVSDRVIKLNAADALKMTLDARVAAIRWDVLAWDLVLDMDTPSAEGRTKLMHRAWLCFRGVSTMTWPFHQTRLPTGCWLSSCIGQPDDCGEFKEYRFYSLIPRIHEDGSMTGNPAVAVSIRAQGVFGLVSVESCAVGSFGLSWKDRIKLASDEELVAMADTER